LNGAETNVRLHPDQKRVLAIRGSRSPPDEQNVTVMFSFAASGSIVDPMIVLPYTKNIPKEIARTIPLEWGIGKSSTGWMTGELFHSYLEKTLYPYLTQRNVTFPIIYFVDGQASHCTYEVSLLCARLQIILICLYPDATRILQPADVAIFKPLKCCWTRLIRKWRSENEGKTFTLKELGPSLSKIMNDEFVSIDTIKNGFRACGLFPFNSQAIDYSKCLMASSNEPDVTDNRTDFLAKLRNIIGSKRIEAHKKGLPCSENDARNILENIIKAFFITPDDVIAEEDEFAEDDVNAEKDEFAEDDVIVEYEIIAKDDVVAEDVLIAEDDVAMIDDTESVADLYFDYASLDIEMTNIINKYDTDEESILSVD
jgi:hypothetical protein